MDNEIIRSDDNSTLKIQIHTFINDEKHVKIVDSCDYTLSW